MTEKTKQHLRRYVVFAMGMIIDSIGIAFITRAGLGTSPISGIPFVLSLILPPTIGTFTFLFNMVYIVAEAILRKEFTKVQAAQIPISLFFAVCIDAAMSIIPSQYGQFYLYSVAYLVIGCVIAAFGISLEVMADVIMLPAEALIRAISKKIGVRFGNVKIGFDTCLTIIAVVIALLSFHKLNGVREGTIFDALFVGQMIKFFVDKGEPMKNKLFGFDEEEELVMELETEAE